MFGFTDFEIHKAEKGYTVKLVTGKNGMVVMESKKSFKDKHAAYNAAEKWWKRMTASIEKQDNLLPVRFV